MTAVTSAPRGKMVNGFDPATATGLTEESRKLVARPGLSVVLQQPRRGRARQGRAAL
jgi:hypothetical protein